ncbi:hypothetical protein SAMN05660236_3762 [Ohtaekwangia koreensis]|uniref:Uncharacterized protein n=1 Tax=Ohtaekwangia koreensis TaxID=688867 RepID=A0A1T5LRC7_9BACT|nr:hypothetical protein SAMN05660236_3762 [Ohtaekwangia koreensis]
MLFDQPFKKQECKIIRFSTFSKLMSRISKILLRKDSIILFTWEQSLLLRLLRILF